MPVMTFGSVVFTPEGGRGIRLTNGTGAASIKGTLVELSTSADNAFKIAEVDSDDPIGVVYEDGVADGQPCVIVTGGRCQGLLTNGRSSIHGNWARASELQAGRISADLTGPPGGTIQEIDAHFHECGHSMQTVTGGTDVLCWLNVHFN
jgi:hypothetical protein